MSTEHKHKITNRTARNIWVQRGWWSCPEIPPGASHEESLNSTGRNISVRRFWWSSGVIVPKEHRRIPADDALEVTIFGQYGEPPNQKDEEMAKVWVPKRGQVTVYDKWSLDVDPLFVRGTGKQSPIALSESAAEREKSSLEIRWKKDLAGRVVGEGNHLKVVFTDEDRGYFKLNDDKTWTITEFHLHARAEHPIQGKYAPIELHIVHQNPIDKTSAAFCIRFVKNPNFFRHGAGVFFRFFWGFAGSIH